MEIDKKIYIRITTDSIRCIFITTSLEWNKYMDLIKNWSSDVMLYLEGHFTISAKTLLEKHRILRDTEEIAAFHTLIGNRDWIGFDFMTSLRLSIDLQNDIDKPSNGVTPLNGMPIMINY